MVPTRFGQQPAAMILRRNLLSVSEASQILGVTTNHLRSCTQGRVRPNPLVREKLPELVRVPLRRLFTAEALEKPYNPKKNPWKPIGVNR